MISRVRIGDLGEVITGNTPPRNKPEYYGSHTPFIKATDIDESSKYTYSPEESYSEVGYKKYRKSLIPKGSTCVVTIGSIGKKMTMAHCDCFINQAMNAIIPSADYDPEYVYYVVKNNVHRLKSLDSGTASGRENVSKSAFSNLEIDVIDDIGIQKRIGSVLSNYDDLIENNQKQIKLLEEAAQRLYKEWFVDLRFPGHETTPIVDGVPEGWCVSSVGDCSCFLRRGISPKYNEEGSSIVINQKCIRQSVVDLNEARRQEKSFAPEMNLNDSDTVICSTGAGTLGRVGQVFGQQPNTTFDSHVTLVRASNIVGRQYLYHFLKSKQQYLQGMGKGSTNQLELNRATIQELVLLIPSVKTQNAFECQAQPIHDQITTLTKQIALLQEARDKLLPKLMRGELENEDF